MTDAPAPGVLEAIVRALDASSAAAVGPAAPRLLAVPVRDDAGVAAGGLWGCTQFGWLQVQFLFVPEVLRGRGLGRVLMGLAEREARARGCVGAVVEAFSFQAAPFYRRLGFAAFGVLDGFPPGHQRIYMSKRYS